MGTLHIVTDPDALAAARAALAECDELVLMHRAAACERPVGAHVLTGDDAARQLLELTLRHARCVTWR